MNTPRERFGINSLGALLFAGALIAALVLGALAMDALWMLIGGVIVLGVIAVVLARIGVNLFAKWTDTRIRVRTIDYDHIERMAKIGYLPAGRRYDPIPPQLEAQSDIPVGVSGATESTVEPYSVDALNLLALSVQWQKEFNTDITQVAPYHVARKNDYFRDVAVWMRAVQFLLVNQIASERMRGGRKMGTYVMTGTVEQAYQRMRSTAALPR